MRKCCRARPPVTLGEGMTPLIHARHLGAELGLERLFVKEEGQNPTNSFKARGISAAVTVAKGLGVHDDCAADRRQRRRGGRGLCGGRRAWAA